MKDYIMARRNKDWDLVEQARKSYTRGGMLSWMLPSDSWTGHSRNWDCLPKHEQRQGIEIIKDMRSLRNLLITGACFIGLLYGSYQLGKSRGMDEPSLSPTISTNLNYMDI